MPDTPFTTGPRRSKLMVVLFLGILLIQSWISPDSFRPPHEAREMAVVSNTDSRLTIPENPRMINASLAFLQRRRQAYVDANMLVNWPLRGTAYLYHHHQILLAAQYMQTTDKEHGHFIRIDNVFPQQQQEQPLDPDYCQRLTMWVRVAGPEIFAGVPEAVSEGNSCYWKYSFPLQVPGTYHIDAKVLIWDSVDENLQTCRGQAGPVPDEILERHPVHAGFKGFKMYMREAGCCESCARQTNPPCRYWATPPHKLPEPSFFNNGCELFFDANVTELPFQSYLLQDINVTLPTASRRRLQQAVKPHDTVHGYPHRGKVERFLGCGWHTQYTLDFPCLSGELDDQVIVYPDNTITVTANDLIPAPVIQNSQTAPSVSIAQPLCSESVEYSPLPPHQSTPGRWVKEAWPQDCPPFEHDKQYSNSFLVSKWDPQYPHCWHRDDLSVIGHQCIEPNCRFIQKWSRYESDFREQQWMGVWRRYDCDYVEFTNEELQQCVTAKKITGFKTQGKSIAEFLSHYVKQRTDPLQMYTGKDGKRVTLTTMAILHKSSLTRDVLIQDLQKTPNVSHDKDIVYLTSGYFLSSQRDVYAHSGTMKEANEKMKEILVPKGYRYINAYDLSTAMSYETATQFDGMHLIGPTCKMVITKMLHHLCHDVVNGTRV